MNLREAHQNISAELSKVTEEASLEANLIIQKATGLSRPVLLSHLEHEISAQERNLIRDMTKLRSTGFPLPYILGEWEFYGHSFFVDQTVLIPRPETELITEKAAAWIRLHPSVRTGFDIGTGSGCIAVSLLLERPELRMIAVDLHRNALQTACKNAERHRVSDRFHPVQCSLFSAFSDRFSLLCANLPYVPTDTCRMIEPARFEPISALDGGEDGFELYRLLFRQIANKMNRECLILCEIEYRQRELALHTASEYFPNCQVKVFEDLAGQPRILQITNEE